MENDNFKKLGEVFEKDIATLIEGIKKEYKTIAFQLDLIKQYDSPFSFQFGFFKHLFKKFCLEGKELNKIINPLMSERLKVFEKLFLSKLEIVNNYAIHYHHHTSLIGDYKIHLYCCLFYSVFAQKIKADNKVQDILTEFLGQWNKFLKFGLMHVNFLIYMPYVDVKNYYIVVENKIFIKRAKIFSFIDKSEENTMIGPYIIYKTEILGTIYKSIQEHNEKKLMYQRLFEKEWNDKLKELREIVCTFYLCGIEFKYEKLVLELPWWFEPLFEEYKDLKNGMGKLFKITEDKVKEIATLYPKVLKTNFFRSENYLILNHHYMQIFNRDFSPDVILDAFIIYEFLFAREIREDISFQLSFNAGFFLAQSEEEFLNIFKFFKKSYKIRSLLIHGSYWADELNKFIQDNDDFNNQNELFAKLKNYINISLKKLINLKLSNVDILDSLFKIDELSSKEKRAIYLNSLGNYYNSDKSYSDALKMYIDSLNIARELNKKELFNDNFNNIKKIYDKQKKFLIYKYELKKVEKELEILVETSSKFSEIAKEIIEKIKCLKEKTNNVDTELVELAIDGNDIMRELSIEPSEKVGNIKRMLTEKVKIKELKNEKDELINFIKCLKNKN